MLWLDENPYNLRNKAGQKRKSILNTEASIEKKRLRNFDHFNSLPNEILLYIFSFLHIKDLYFKIRMVCKRWHQIAMLCSAWRNVNVNNHIPKHILNRWIQFSPVIKQIKMCNRNDADDILENVAKYSTHLESITIEDCWGSPERIYLRSSALCKLLTRCKKLGKIHFDRVKIRSCKFFKLLARRKNNTKSLQLSYIGPVTNKQFNALKESCSGWIFTEFIEIDDSSD